MKKNIYIITLLAGLLGLASCQQTEYPLFDESVTTIYFANDSTGYSFGILPLDKTEYTLDIPVRIMGKPVNAPRTFTVEVMVDKTNASTPTHYTLPQELTLAPDSMRSVVPLTLHRENLGAEEWRITLRLTENEHFSPVEKADEKMGDTFIVTFNNVVSKPNWVNSWTGEFGWPEYELGLWNPVVYVTFMDFFHQLKDIAPMTYQNMVNLYGENLDNGKYSGWDYDYNYTLTKHILLPMYDYFQKHPELGVSDFPKPNA